MQQRAGGADPDPFAAEGVDGPPQHGSGHVEIGAPDVATVDEAQRQDAVFGQVRQCRIKLLGRAHQVEVDGRHRQRECQRQVFVEAAEVSGQHQRRVFGPAQRRVGLPIGLSGTGRQITH